MGLKVGELSYVLGLDDSALYATAGKAGKKAGSAFGDDLDVSITGGVRNSAQTLMQLADAGRSAGKAAGGQIDAQLTAAGKSAASSVEAALRSTDASGLTAAVKSESSSMDAAAKAAGKSAGKEVSDGVKDGEGRLGEVMKGGLDEATPAALTSAAAMGAAVGAVILDTISESLERNSLSKVLEVRLGAGAKVSGEAGRIAGDLYYENFGDSLEQVYDAVDAVGRSLTDMNARGGGDLKRLTGKALNLASVFGVDVADAAYAAGVVVKNKLAKDGDQAIDLLLASLQRVPPAMRGDLIDAVKEYSPYLASLGYTGEEAFGMLVKAANLSMYGIDKTGDSLKELSLRATDLTDSGAQNALKIMGINGHEAANALLAGGDAAKQMTERILFMLASVKDPAQQAALAIALFGTPMEDLSKEQIPQLIQAMLSGEGALGSFTGKAEEMGDTLSGSTSSKVEAFKRNFKRNLGEMGDEAILFLADNDEFMRHWSMAWGLIGTIVSAAKDGIIDKLNQLGSESVDTMNGSMGVMVGGAEWMKAVVISQFEQLIGYVSALPGKVANAVSGMWNGIMDSFKSAMNWIIDKWNSFGFKFPTVDVPMLGKVGGWVFDTPNIPRFHTGTGPGGVPGLMGSEVPAILRAGEVVRTAGQEASLQSSLGGPGRNVVYLTVPVTFAGPVAGRDGERWISDTITKAVRKGYVIKGVNAA